MQVPGFQGGDRVESGSSAGAGRTSGEGSALGKPVVLVMLNGSAVAVNWAKDHVPAIVELWYPGQAGGTALADVLFGDANPAGRLPVTFYKSADQLPPFDDYKMEGRTYRYFKGEPLYPFGYGLSYTTFRYGKLMVPPEVKNGAEMKVSVDVENSGKRAGDEVVQLYVKREVRSLEGFQRVSLKPGEKRTVEFTFSPHQLGTGAIEISAGGDAGAQAISAKSSVGL